MDGRRMKGTNLLHILEFQKFSEDEDGRMGESLLKDQNQALP